jgi:hypothetical protein
LNWGSTNRDEENWTYLRHIEKVELSGLGRYLNVGGDSRE